MGPLAGVRVVEFTGVGPAPFCAMMLADMGAEVLRLDRAGAKDLLGQERDILARGKHRVALDLKQPAGREAALRLCTAADVLIEGFRPGVMERLGLGPDECLAANPRLVYGRMTGWGQDGPLAAAAGHDINFVALSGALHAIGTATSGPVPPLNLVGDFGGGGMLLAFGVVCALFEARRSGQGQVVDAAMVDGAALLMAMIYSLKGNSLWDDRRGYNLIDGAAPFYGTYQCACGNWIALGAIEPQFYTAFRETCGLADACFDQTMDRALWPAQRTALAAVFARRSREDWGRLLEGTDACLTPVLDLTEAPEHPHNRARATFINRDGMAQPAPAPRFSRTPAEARDGAAPADTARLLADWGLSEDEIAALITIN